MNRLWIWAGATALAALLPCVVLSAPTGGAVYRAAPVIVRPAFPQRGADQNRDNFKVPFHIDAAPKSAVPDTLRLPTTQWSTHHAWTWKPSYVFLSEPCFANGANWAPLQSFTASQSMPDVQIGSLAGDPKHSLLGSHGSDIAKLASSSTGAVDSSNQTGLQIQWQPSVCGQQW
jgi:hypothetical protein